MMIEENFIEACVLDENWEISLDSVCKICSVDFQLVVEMAEHGLVELKGRDKENSFFTGSNFYRFKKALRLYKDLEVNFEGIDIILRLIEERDALKRRLNCKY